MNSTFGNQSGLACGSDVQPPQGVEVGVALRFLLPVSGGPRLFWLLDRILASELAENGVEICGARGTWGPHFICCVYKVCDRRAALPVLKRASESFKIDGLVQIAWFCEAEGIWRVVHGGPEPFGELLKDEHFEACRAEIDVQVRAAVAAIKILAGQGAKRATEEPR